MQKRNQINRRKDRNCKWQCCREVYEGLNNYMNNAGGRLYYIYSIIMEDVPIMLMMLNKIQEE
jgi:hypothetical protein